jgi:hypothetical protein
MAATNTSPNTLSHDVMSTRLVMEYSRDTTIVMRPVEDLTDGQHILFVDGGYAMGHGASSPVGHP